MAKINRSTYMKVVQQNKRLLQDIKIITGPISVDGILLGAKYRKEFEDQQKMVQAIMSLIKENE